MNPNDSFPKDLYPFSGSHLNFNGISMHYLNEGAGDPLIMVHGNPTWSFFFRDLVRGLKDQYQVIVPDHIGCGLSDKPDDSRYTYDLEHRVQDLERLIDHLQFKKPLTLILHDWGGMIGMAYATRHPERIGRLVLLNSAAFHLPKTRQLPPSLWMCRKTFLGDFLVRKTGLFIKLTLGWCCCKPMSDAVRKGYLYPYQTSKDRIAHIRFVEDIALTPTDRSDALITQVESRIPIFNKTPTLMLWGDKDFVFDEHFFRVWSEKLPNAQVHHFPDAGHYVLEDAGDQILPLIQKFLKENPLA